MNFREELKYNFDYWFWRVVRASSFIGCAIALLNVYSMPLVGFEKELSSFLAMWWILYNADRRGKKRIVRLIDERLIKK